MIRFGIVGCGEATQQLHLPAIVQFPDVRIEWVSDPLKTKLKPITNRLGINNVVSDYREVRDIDAVLIATPHNLHAEMVEHFLNMGVHVLCEKPLALTCEEGERLVMIANDRKLVLSVGVFRRYYHTSRLVKQMLASGWLGNLLSVDIEEGGRYDWNLQSTFMMEREKSGGGVLADTGAHTVDRILWLVGETEPTITAYRDNNKGGIESDCELNMTLQVNNAIVPVRIELSRTRDLRNTFELVFEHGTVSFPANSFSDISLHDKRLYPSGTEADKMLHIHATRDEGAAIDLGYYFLEQMKDFLSAIGDGHEVLNSGASVLPGIGVIEKCYLQRTDMEEPWHSLDFFRTECGEEGVR